VDITKSLEHYADYHASQTQAWHCRQRATTIRTLPKIMAYGSELNQVWTNLIATPPIAIAKMASCAFVRLEKTISFSWRSPTMVPAFLPSEVPAF